MSKRLDKLDNLFDILKDQILGREKDYSGGLTSEGFIRPPKDAIKGVLPRIEELEATIRELTGIVEQLAALHGKEIVDFKPTTSEYGQILVDTKETDSGTTD